MAGPHFAHVIGIMSSIKKFLCPLQKVDNCCLHMAGIELLSHTAFDALNSSTSRRAPRRDSTNNSTNLRPNYSYFGAPDTWVNKFMGTDDLGNRQRRASRTARLASGVALRCRSGRLVITQRGG